MTKSTKGIPLGFSLLRLMAVKIGLRVVRGPDWEGGDQDGGEGFVGTVVARESAEGATDERHCVATVQWDVGGERRFYRCGAEGKHDLRVLDSGPAGVVHHHMGCTVCGVESIAGCLWRCLHCLRYYLCTPCYMQNRHSVWHHFMRIDSPDNPNQRTRVRCRYLSCWVPARGVFPGARVVRGHDWKWGDQDGGLGREGSVQEIDGWHSESSRSVAVVEWGELSRKRKYRCGHKGKVDLQCTVAAEGGYCYLDHLPVLGSECAAPTVPFLCAGDRAMIEMEFELLKSSLDKIGAWTDSVVDFLGKVGLVNCVVVDEAEAVLIFPVRGILLHMVSPAMKKVEGPHVLSDDVVRVIEDMAEVHRVQKEGRGWEDDMALTLGQLGRVGVLIEDGCVVVVVDGKRWLLDPRCLVPAHGEQPEDELSEAEIMPGIDLLWLTMLKEPDPEMLAGAALRGCAKILEDILTKWPASVHSRHKEKTLLHVTAAEGRLNATRVLLKHKADIAAKDNTGEVPLHNAAHFNHYHVAKLLLDEGSDVNARGNAGNTSMHVAAAMGFSRLLQLFLEHPKCDVNAQDQFGDTALHFACRGYWPATTKVLLEAGADTTLLNLQAANPFLHAVVKGFYSGVEMYTQFDPEVINQCKIDDGYTPLHVATHASHCDELCYLAAIDTCEVDKRTYIEQTALHIASRDGHTLCLECLVGYGADVRAEDSLKNTPLHFVLAKRNTKHLSEWTLHLNKVHEEVSAADNSIQNVPVYMTVACFLASEGASLEVETLEGLTPLGLCPPEYLPLLRLFARPERRGSYSGSLPRHPPPVPIPLKPREQKAEAKSESRSVVATPTDTKTTPTENEAPPTDSKATPTKVSVSVNTNNKSGNESDNSSPKLNVRGVTEGCFLCERPCDICFQPCGHTAMCAVCAAPVKRCPTCRNDVSEKIKINV